jgi:hypothetical protein
MDAVQIGETCDKLKRQGMPEHLAVIHAITYGLTLFQTDNDGKYVKLADLPTFIEQEVQRVLKRWMKYVVAPIGGVAAIMWAVISHWDNVVKFSKSLGQ